ncbi:MAG: methyl-accepting chemotaxis protein [Treponema sp.]|nr:methyl-accepting chemotaxis protein [Treponema sp.]
MYYLFIILIMGMLIMGAAMIPVVRSYRKRIAELEKINAESANGLSEFRYKTVKLAAAVKESAGSISLLGRDSGTMGKSHTGSIENIENTINKNSKIAAEIVEKTGSVAAIASKMEEHVIQGFMILEKNVKKMEDIKEKNSGAINGIISLSNKVGKIRDIVRIINTITDQTKVIAFNAALEAASAGETGKRFSVVAGEVNRLADNIDVLTRQIREQVEEVLSSSSSLIMYSEEGSDKIAEGYRLIKDLEDVFEEIKSAAEITSNQAQTITVSTQEQLKTSGQVNAGIAEISTLVKSLIGASETTVMTASALTERTNELEQFLSVKEIIEQV